MGKFIDTKKMQDETLLQVRRLVEALVKQHKYAELDDIGEVFPGEWMIQVSSPEQLSHSISAIINRHPRCTLVSAAEHPGSYDWASGVYIKDCSTVTFRIK